MSTHGPRWPLLLSMLLPACGSDANPGEAVPSATKSTRSAASTAACEHARDAVVKEMEDSETPLLVAIDNPAVKQQRLAMLQTRTGRVRDHFVEECLKVMPEHEACVTRIDEAVAGAREHRADLVMCATRLEDGAAEVDRCRNAAEDKAKRRVGVCGETLDRILAPIEESYRREQIQRTVDEKKTETKVVEAKLEPRTP